MPILITGGAGFIGRYFCERFSREGISFRILDLVPPPFPLAGDSFVQGDVRVVESLRKAIEGCDAVLHLAAAHHDFGIDRDTYYSVNEHGAETVCRTMDEAGIRRVCFLSSVAVYGDAAEPRHEDTVPQPVTHYGASKLAGEKVFQRWVETDDARSALVIRPTMTFGAHNFANMYSLLKQIHRGHFLPVGRGTNAKSIAYVENLVDATIAMWRRERAPRFDVFNYVDKPDLTSRDIARLAYQGLDKSPPQLFVPLALARLLTMPFDGVIRITGRNLPISSARLKKFAVDRTVYEADKLRAAGYKPSVALSDGIDRMAKWFASEGINKEPIWHIPPAEPVFVSEG